MQELKVKGSVVNKVYGTESPEGQKAIERLLGADVIASIMKRYPVGVWCLGLDKSIKTASEWNKLDQSQGVLVVTENTAFVVAPHASVALQWGPADTSNKYTIKDESSFDSKAATDAIVAAYNDSRYSSTSGKIYDVYGAPAAEWCRQYAHGNILAGEWDLPTVAQLKVMSENRDEINECFMAMGGYRLTPGWYWSSIEKDESVARCVYMSNGYVNLDYKKYYYYVRAVSAFPVE